MILHTIRSLHARQSEGLPLEHANQMNLKLVLFMDILQFPLSLIFTRFLNIFSGMILIFGQLIRILLPEVFPEGSSF